MKILLLFFLISCGGETKVVEIPAPGNPSNPGNPGGGGDKTSFAEASQIMNQYCERCHSNSPWLQSEQALRNSRGVKNRTANKSMPPNANSMPDGARQRLLDFF